MRPRGQGVIINTASAAALVGAPGTTPYTASKHGILGITRTVALELATTGVRVNAVAPGTVETPLNSVLFDNEDPFADALVRKGQPIGRNARPDEIADAVLWHASTDRRSSPARPSSSTEDSQRSDAQSSVGATPRSPNTRVILGASAVLCGRCWERARMSSSRVWSGPFRLRVSLGTRWVTRCVDRYLEFVAGRCRPNTVRAVAFDLKVFFTVSSSVIRWRCGRRTCSSSSPISAAIGRWSAWLIASRACRRARSLDGLSSVSGFYAYLVARGDTAVTSNPVPRGLQTRRTAGRARDGAAGAGAADVAEDPVAGRGRRVVGGAAHGSGPGDGVGDAARRAAPLRSARAAPRRRPCRRSAAVRRRRQGRPSTVVPIANRFFTAVGDYLTPSAHRAPTATGCSSC